MKKLYFGGAFLHVALSALLLLSFSAACSSGGGNSDGDIDIIEQETCDIKCDPGCYIVNCECKCPDGDKDATENDGDLTEEDGDDFESDGDLSEVEYEEEDEGVDYDIELPEFEIDPEQEGTCVCDPEDPFSCGAGYYCDGCWCQLEDGDGDAADAPMESDYEGILCDSGLPRCYGFDSESDTDLNIGHEACPTNMACDIEDGCCTRGIVTCDNPLGCPGHWHCLSNVNACDYECLKDSDCQKKYKSAAWSCSSNGWCVIVDGDVDEEEPQPCHSCADCNGPTGQYPEGGYYCSSRTGLCEPQPDEDGCCNSTDCIQGFACDPYDGRCKWNGISENVGRISGTLTTSADFAAFTYVVKCYRENGTLEAQSSNISPQYVSGEYRVNYNLFQLSEGEKTVKISAIHLPSQESPFHANPVIINYLSQDNTYVTGINFYIGVPNPMLGSIGGTVRVASQYDDDYIKVQLLKAGTNGWQVQKTAELFPEYQVGDLRNFSFTNLNPGSTHNSVSYYLRALIYHDGEIEYDYKPNAYVINLANPAQLHYDNEKLFAGYVDSSFGSVSGKVFFHPFYSDASFTKNVKLYNDYQSKYESGVARISNLTANGFDYEIRNVESRTYWLRYESEVFGVMLVALPGPSETVIYVDPQHKDLSVNIYLDVPQPWVGSISGTISFTQAQISEGLFRIQAYYNNTFTAPALDSPETVLRYDFETDTAQYFLDRLESGSYYIKAWLEDPDGGILDEEIWGGESSPIPVTVDAESSTPELKDVGGIDLDFTSQ